MFFSFQDLSALRAEISSRESSIQDKKSRNELQAKEGLSELNSNLEQAKAFVDSKVQLRKDLLNAYKRKAQDEILENLLLMEAVRTACTERGIPPPPQK